MESPKSPTSQKQTRKNIFSRATHKISKRLKGLFTRRNRQSQHTMSQNQQTPKTTTVTIQKQNSPSTASNKIESENEFLLLQFLESKEIPENIKNFIESNQVYLIRNYDSPTIKLLFKNISEYNETEDDLKKNRSLNRINFQIKTIEKIMALKRTLTRATARASTQVGGQKKMKKWTTSKTLKKKC
jgi:hypothetical protein